MKRILLSLVAIVIASVCFAQDVIVKKDGSTIQAKVLKVTQSEVEYKNFSNQNGPTYTISTRDLQCINYENGSTDKFVSENYNPNIVTNETATQYSNDSELLLMYNSKKKYESKAKTLKTVGWIAGGVLVATGVVLSIFLTKSKNTYWSGDGKGNWTEVYKYHTNDTMLGVGIGTIAVGIGAWAGFYFAGKHLEKKSQYSVQSSPLYRQEFKVGKSDRLMVGVDLLKDNTFKHQTLGLGFAYNF